MTSRYAILGLVALPLLLVTGCGDAEGLGAFDEDIDMSAELDESENIATAVSAMCTVFAADHSSDLDMTGGGPALGYSYTESTSPTSTYGTAACSGRYVVEGTDLGDIPSGVHLLARASWGAFELSQPLCPQAKVDMTVYAEELTLNGLQWVTIGDFSAMGSWNGSSCSLSKTVEVPQNHLRRVRVAARASYPVLGVMVPAKVTGTIVATPVVFEEADFAALGAEDDQR